MGNGQVPSTTRRRRFSRVSLIGLDCFLKTLTTRKLEKGWYKIENVSETTDPNIQVITKVKGAGDPGYLNTCRECVMNERFDSLTR